METMVKQKTKFGIIEEMPNGKLYGFVTVAEMNQDKEVEIISNYIDLGWQPVDNNYIISGGEISSIEFAFINEDGEREDGEMPYISHGVIVMKTLLKKYVPTKNK